MRTDIVAAGPTTDETNGNVSQAITYDENRNPVLNQIFDLSKIDPTTQVRLAYTRTVSTAQTRNASGRRTQGPLA
jgi:hypothetical protein